MCIKATSTVNNTCGCRRSGEDIFPQKVDLATQRVSGLLGLNFNLSNTVFKIIHINYHIHVCAETELYERKITGSLHLITSIIATNTYCTFWHLCLLCTRPPPPPPMNKRPSGLDHEHHSSSTPCITCIAPVPAHTRITRKWRARTAVQNLVENSQQKVSQINPFATSVYEFRVWNNCAMWRIKIDMGQK